MNTDGQKLVEILQKTYPRAKCELIYENPWQLLIAVILSAQCTDKRVNLVTPGLFRKFPSVRHFAEVSQSDLEEAIRSTGFYRNKARNIRLCCQALVEHFGGRVPDTMEELLTLDGVGRKTANVILHVAYGKNEGVCVDTHVLRLSGRLGLSQKKTPEQVERELMKQFPREQWGDLTTWLIWHGRRRCYARNPDCAHCELFLLCSTGKKLISPSKKQLCSKPGFGRQRGGFRSTNGSSHMKSN
jgi:endonuclease-3